MRRSRIVWFLQRVPGCAGWAANVVCSRPGRV